jgi:PfaB family protein
LGRRDEALFAVEADSTAGLLQGLAQLRAHAQAAAGPGLEQLAGDWLQRHPQQPVQPLACALVARNAHELLRQVASQEQALRQGQPARSTDAVLVDRVFTTPADGALAGTLAFVFPGSGNHFPGMGRDLSAQWPEVFRRQEAENQRLRSQYAPELFWDLPSLDQLRDHRALIQGQVALGTAVSDLLQSFGLRPDATLGYSLGETTALFALRVWRDRDEMLHRLFSSPLFSEQLAGKCTAAQAAWGLGPDEPVDWVAGVVASSADEVRRALAGKHGVYLLVINTPGECVVGGQRGAVERVVAELQCPFVRLTGVSTVHCPIAREVEEAYRALHRLPVTPVEGLHLYSSAWGRKFTPDEETCSEAITAQALTTVDFAKLIRRAYADGVRHFIEIGPGASCTRMIGQILVGQPHLARSAYVAGQGVVSGILRLLAQLIAARVPVDLAPLYCQPTVVPEIAPESQSRKKSLTVIVGHPPLQMPAPPQRQRPAATQPADRVVHSRSEWTEAPASTRGASGVPSDTRTRLIRGLVATQAAGAAAHGSYLQFVERARQIVSDCSRQLADWPNSSPTTIDPDQPAPAFDRSQCLELAIGSLGRVLGPDYAEVDSFPTRVRLPAEPLMLVDRILTLEGEPKSLQAGRIVTEHDVHPGDWYLDNGRMPASITIESGQADLALSGYLGIDFHTRGLAVYRLLDATVTFHRPLPEPSEITRYDIRIDRFFRQGDTHLFRFRFEGTVNGEPLLTMTDGCAGFFSAEELASGKGIVRGANVPRPDPVAQGPWQILVPMQPETYSASQLDALRAGNLSGCFGEPFAQLTLSQPLTLPSGERLRLIHRVSRLDPQGGAYGLGVIRGEQDIHPDDWFLTCHFVDDQVMPGTLMYECCLHTLRIYLLRLGWIADVAQAHFEPRPGIAARLKCRGQVIATTRTASYEITIKKLGKEPYPWAIADALMYADGKPIVEIADMSLQLRGVAYADLERLWQSARPAVGRIGNPSYEKVISKPIFDRQQVLAFALGKPSEAYGDPYKPFDHGRRLARLPAPPYSFLDRVLSTTAEPFRMVAGGTAEAEYDIPEQAWYFQSNRQTQMPFAVLQEVALQACGWMAAYVGSALTSAADLRFRNLGGTAVQLAPVTAASGTLTTSVRFTKVVSSGGMIIQDYEFTVRDGRQVVFQGQTNFGFFTDAMMARQVGLREVSPYRPSAEELSRGRTFPYPVETPFPDRRLRMIDHIEQYVPDGGPHGQGLILGIYDVDPDAWFFQAHFFQDPVCPGSLGLEAFLQLLKVFAVRRFGGADQVFETPVLGQPHRWLYRGQVVPANARVEVQAVVTACDARAQSLVADGWLSVDGLLIYQMNEFSLRVVQSQESPKQDAGRL